MKNFWKKKPEKSGSPIAGNSFPKAFSGFCFKKTEFHKKDFHGIVLPL